MEELFPENLTTVTVPDSMKTLSMYNIVSPSFTDIDLGNGVEIIESYSIYNMSDSLTEINLPTSLLCMHPECLMVESEEPVTINYEGTVEQWSKFRHYYSFEAEYINCIDGSAYIDDQSEDVEFTDDMTTLIMCPTDCSTLTIPVTVNRILPYCFMGCSELAEITYEGTKKQWKKKINKMNHWNDESVIEVIHCADGDINFIVRIHYTSTDGEIVEPNKEQPFIGATIIDNVYDSENDIGTFILKSEAVTGVDRYAFEYCTNLKTIELPNTITNIEYLAFRNCTGLTSITMPNSVVSLGESAFSDCTSLSKVKLSSNISELDEGVFYNCTSLVSITIPDSVTSICSNGYTGTFQNCTALKTVKLPNNLKTLGYSSGSGVFYGCTNLTKITIPNSVEFISSNIFNNCTEIIEDYTENGMLIKDNCLIKVNNANDNFVIPNNIRLVAANALSSKSNVKSITIPSSVKYICDYAFSLTSIPTITIPSSVKKLGNGVFNNCTKLTTITIPDTIESMGDSLFCYCSALNDVTLPSNLTYIPRLTFKDCTSLTSINIPSAVVKICSEAFYNCGIVDFIVPEGILSIESQVFGGNYILTLSLPSTLNSILSRAIYEAENFINVTIDQNNTKYTSRNTSGTESNYIYDKVSKALIYAHSSASEIPSDVITISEYACCDMNLTGITLPSTLTRIGYNAFTGAYSNDTLTIPLSVTNIDSYAFQNIDIDNVVILGNISELVYSVFNGANMSSIAIPNSVTYFRQHCLASIKKPLTIYYNGSLDEWNSIGKDTGSWGWDEYTVIIKIIGDGWVEDRSTRYTYVNYKGGKLLYNYDVQNLFGVTPKTTSYNEEAIEGQIIFDNDSLPTSINSYSYNNYMIKSIDIISNITIV